MNKRIVLTLSALAVSAVTAFAQQWTLSTNALDYVDFGTLNIEGAVAVHRHFALDLGIKYNPWSFGNKSSNLQKQNRQRMFYGGVKWYPWFIYDGWHFDAMIGYKEYNSGGIFSQRTEEGDAFGGGIGFGYTLPVHKNFNVEFGAMLWGGRKTYIVYSCPVCGKAEEQGSKFFIMPTNITIGATWVLGKTREERRREQERKNYVEQ